MRNFLLLSVFFFAMILTAEAHQGCCSWHGGVCGCQCCDGSPLSDKCAPYYPECSASNSTDNENNGNPSCLNKCLSKGVSQENCENICSNQN